MTDSNTTSDPDGGGGITSPPNPPLSFLSLPSDLESSNTTSTTTTISSLTLTFLEKEFKDVDDRREKAYSLSRLLDRKINESRSLLSFHPPSSMEVQSSLTSLSEMVSSYINSNNDNNNNNSHPRRQRDGNLHSKFQDVVRLVSYHHFLSKGSLLPLSTCRSHLPLIQDEEYLGGVISMCCEDLSRYAVGRAIERDARSVVLARDVVSRLMGCLLAFDFRNGMLRRKYDGVKWALKRLETILYELTLAQQRERTVETTTVTTTATANNNHDTDTLQPVSKRSKPNDSSPPANNNNNNNNTNLSNLTLDDNDKNEIETLRKRMEHRDDMRERIIKRCRDAQKSAKQSIFARHRGDNKRSDKLLSQCEVIAEELLPLIHEEPMLRYGSFANAMEEYAEAKLFALWLNERRVGSWDDLGRELVTAEEYIGGLCDFTGEVGRWAVVKGGTVRDVNVVKFCLATNLRVLMGVQSVVLPGKLQKKIEPLKHSVEKLEHMLYELSLLGDENGRERLSSTTVVGTGGCIDKDTRHFDGCDNNHEEEY